jgi:hypothetical protein
MASCGRLPIGQMPLTPRTPRLRLAAIRGKAANLQASLVFAAGNPITAVTIRELIRTTGGKDRRRYQDDRRFEKRVALGCQPATDCQCPLGRGAPLSWETLRINIRGLPHIYI